MKVNLIILDVVNDALIPHLSMKTTTHEMWEPLKNLFKKNNKN